jgi:hypothetical protein
VLLEQTEFEIVDRVNITVVSRFGARDDPKDRRLPRAIPAHDAYLFVGIHLERDTAKHLITAVRFFNVRNSEKHIKNLPAVRLEINVQA